MMRPAALAFAMAIATTVFVRGAEAQPALALPGRVELAGGVLWMGAQSLGSRDANLTTGTGSALRLFSSSSDLAGAPALEARVAIRVAGAIDLEATASRTKRDLRTRLSNDAENALGATVAETVDQYVVGAAVVWYPQSRRLNPRIRPFVIAGGNYLRQLHEAATLVESGETYDIGGGVKWFLATRTRKRMKAIGIRVDGRVVVHNKGITFDGRRTISPAAAALFFARF